MSINTICDGIRNLNLESTVPAIKEVKARDIWGWHVNSKKAVPEAVRDVILGNGHSSPTPRRLEMVEVLLSEGLDPAVTVRCGNGDTRSRPLVYFAVKAGDAAMLQLLVENCARKKHCEFAAGMEAAIEAEKLDVLVYLLKNGAKVDGYMEGDCPKTRFLTKAALLGKRHMVEFFISKGASVRGALLNLRAVFVTHYRKEPELQQQAAVAFRRLADYAMGIDLGNSELESREWSTFFAKNTFTECNFVGISLQGKPITQEMLGLRNSARNCLFLLSDIEKLEDRKRRTLLKDQLEGLFTSMGRQVDADGVVNLVPLAFAAAIGDLPTVKLRSEAGCDPNQEIEGVSQQMSAIEAAVLGRHYEVVQFLVGHPRLDATNYAAALTMAERVRDKEMMAILRDVNMNLPDRDGMTPLHRAIVRGNLNRVQALIAKGVDVDREAVSIAVSCETVSIEILKALFIHGDHSAIHSGHLLSVIEKNSVDAFALLWPIVKKQLTKLSLEDPLWYTKLVQAALGKSNWKFFLESLLQAGARLDGGNYVESAIMTVMEQFRDLFRYTRVQQLLSTPTQMQELKDEHIAAFHTSYDRLDFLLQHGVSVVEPLPGTEQLSPLHHFLWNAALADFPGASVKVIDRFIQAKVPLDLTDGQGRTFLDVAILAKNREAEACLRQRIADVHGE